MIKPNAVMLRLMSMESIDETVETPVVVTDSEQLKDDIETGELEGAFDGLVQVIENLKRIRESISGSLAEGGLSHGAAEGYISAVSAAVEPVSLDGSTIMLTHECFDKDDIRLRATELSMESIGKTISKVATKAAKVFTELVIRMIRSVGTKLGLLEKNVVELSALKSDLNNINSASITLESVKGPARLLFSKQNHCRLEDVRRLNSLVGQLPVIVKSAEERINELTIIDAGGDEEQYSRTKSADDIRFPEVFYTANEGNYFYTGVEQESGPDSVENATVNIPSLIMELDRCITSVKPAIDKLKDNQLLKSNFQGKLRKIEERGNLPYTYFVYPREALVFVNSILGVISNVVRGVVSLSEQVIKAS